MEACILKLHEIGAVKFGDFTLISDIRSSISIDCRTLPSYPEFMDNIADMMWELVTDESYDLICGVPYADQPIPSFVSKGKKVPMLNMRKEVKTHGTKDQIQGNWKGGDSCLLFEDIIVSGSSLFETIKVLETAKLKVKQIIVFINMQQGGVAHLEKEGYTIKCVLTINQIVDVLVDNGKLELEKAESIKKYIERNKIGPIPLPKDDLDSNLETLSIEKLPSSDLETLIIEKMSLMKHIEKVSLMKHIENMSLMKRIEMADHPVTKKLLQIIFDKKSNISEPADMLFGQDILEIANNIASTLIDYVKLELEKAENIRKNESNIIDPMQFLKDALSSYLDILSIVKLPSSDLETISVEKLPSSDLEPLSIEKLSSDLETLRVEKLPSSDLDTRSDGRMPLMKLIEMADHPATKKLLQIIHGKKSTISLAADVLLVEDFLLIANSIVDVLIDYGKVEREKAENESNKIDPLSFPMDALSSNLETLNVGKLSLMKRIEMADHPATKKLLQIIQDKKTNLCVAADVASAKDLLKMADSVGPHICILKTHMYMFDDFTWDAVLELKMKAKKFNFLIMEDSKFGSIGKTARELCISGADKIMDFADLVTVQGSPDSDMITGLKSMSKKSQAGIIVAEMRYKEKLRDNTYVKDCLSMATKHPDFVIGFLALSEITSEADHIIMIPRVSLTQKSDSLGQQYISPADAIQHGSDIIIVDQTITNANDMEATAKEHKEIGYSLLIENKST